MAEKKIGIINLDVVSRTVTGNGAKTIWPEFPYPIAMQTATGVTVKKLGQHDRSLRDSMLEAGKKLIDSGADAIVGGCGFMGLFQQDFANEFKIPCMLSSLCQIPMASMLLGKGEKIGVLAANASPVNQELFNIMGINTAIPIYIKGLQDKPHFNKVVNMDGPLIDTDVMKREIIESATEMLKEEPAIKVIVCECTLLPVYRQTIKEVTKLPVFDWELMLDHLYAGL